MTLHAAMKMCVVAQIGIRPIFLVSLDVVVSRGRRLFSDLNADVACVRDRSKIFT